MALADVARDELEEMLREEAEDVFYEDGRLEARAGGRAPGPTARSGSEEGPSEEEEEEEEKRLQQVARADGGHGVGVLEQADVLEVVPADC